MSDAPRLFGFPHLEPVIKEYESALGIALHLHRPFRFFSKPRGEPGFHLHLFALPKQFPWMSWMGETPMTGLPIAFGHPLREGARQVLIIPRRMGKGIALRDDEGNALAYLHPRNVFILFDLAGQGEELAPLLLRLLLDRSLKLMSADLVAQNGLHPDRVEFILVGLRRTTGMQEWDWREKRRVLARRQFQDRRWAQIGGEIGFLETEIRSTEEALEIAALQITAETRHLQEYRRRLRHLRGELINDEADLVRDLDLLSKCPDVADVTASPTGLRVITRRIQAAQGGKQFSLGAFQIDLLYNGEITIYNLTSRHGYYDHPHIWNGKPCLGNVRQGLAKLIGEYQLAAASEVVIDFLKTINPKDWHTSIEHWREISDTEDPAAPSPGILKPIH
ncbi:MAG: hypothetical protein HY278_05085 [candidate division NC10 bacterium]|nr:hypothetical protein [candidate division NC10 bacterium]